MPVDIRVIPAERLSDEAAVAVAGHIRSVLVGADRVMLALAGGHTPRGLYEALGAGYRDEIPWSRVHLFWGDERYVPHDDASSNYRLVRESLLDRVPVPVENVHAMATAFPEPADAAAAYEAVLRGIFPGPWPRFDLILLGMGPDGHTASLFPGSPALAERGRWVTAVRAPAPPPRRLTLTLPVLNHAALVFFLVAGAGKAEALRRVLDDAADPSAYPARAVGPPDGRVVWWVDPPAAALLAKGR